MPTEKRKLNNKRYYAKLKTERPEAYKRRQERNNELRRINRKKLKENPEEYKKQREIQNEKDKLWRQKFKLNSPEKYEKRKSMINKQARACEQKLKLENLEEHRKRRRKYKLKAEYGITPDEYEAIKQYQDNICPVCKKPLDETVCVDHCHNSGKVRGLVHNKCNLLLGASRESEEILLGAIQYLEKNMESKDAL